MISEQKINAAAELLISSGSARKVILFGSYARGDATEDSDVDFLVVERDVPSKVTEMVRLRRILRPLRLPFDVMVVSENDLEDWGQLPGTALYWALKEGKVLQDATA
jgi:predicted nucleotidyltransferase